MSSKKKRLFTRWFSRRIDLGVILSGGLFVLIWFFLPTSPRASSEENSVTVPHVQVTSTVLSEVLPYMRPDLMMVPSRYTFTPMWEMSDKVTEIPYYPYATSLYVSLSPPEGMGRLASLLSGMGRNESNALLLPRTVMPGEHTNRRDGDLPRLDVRMSEGLGTTRLRTDALVWQQELQDGEPWRFAFWVSFHDGGEQTASVFVEQRSGDLERDLRLLRIVERLDIWEHPVGEGIVWLRYAPIVGEKDAD